MTTAVSTNSLYLQIDLVDENQGSIFSQSQPEAIDGYTLGQTYHAMQREYGRCTGHVYVDGADGKPLPVGWVFESRQEYEDAHGHWGRGTCPSPSEHKERCTYLRHAWVTILRQAVEDRPTTVYHAVAIT